MILWTTFLVMCGAVPNITGVWTKLINQLPNNKLPHVPLLGNGYIGVAMDSKTGSTVPPGQTSAVDFWINSNANWDVLPNTSPLPKGFGSMAGLGGVSIRPTAVEFTEFRAEQRIGPGQLYSRQTTSKGSKWETLTAVHPTLNAIITDVTWTPVQGDPTDLAVDITTWVTPGRQSQAGCGSTAGRHQSCTGASSMVQYITRRVSSSPSSPKYMWVGLATTARGSVTYHGTTVATNASATTHLTIHSGKSVSLVTAHSDTLFADPSVDPSGAAMALSLKLDPGQTQRDAVAWWKDFWGRSSVSLPTQPAVEQFWYGAQYISGCMASTDPRVPPPGLFGPWVTMDHPAWHGDYTLDYNQEAQFYGVYGSNHPEVAVSYFNPILDWIPTARAMAQIQGKAAHVNCSTSALHYSCHLAPWGMQSQDRTIYMHWNGPYASLLFINHWEYTRNVTFLREATYPLLDGINSWWHCFLCRNDTKVPYVLEDANQWNPDEDHENQKVPNPQIGLSFIRRTVSQQIAMAKVLGVTAPSYLQDIMTHLVPFNVHPDTTVAGRGGGLVWTAYEGATPKQSDMFSLYPIWPSEFITGNASENILDIARRSSDRYSNFPTGRPVELFPAAVRSRLNPTDVIKGLNGYLHGYQGPNLLPYAPGGGTENVGVSRAVNEMLLQAPDGEYLMLFPAWPVGEPAGFRTLRAKGGFLVSADYDGKVVSNVVIQATVGPGTCQVKTPWGATVKVIVLCGGRSVPVTWNHDGDRFDFPAPPGVVCRVTPQA